MMSKQLQPRPASVKPQGLKAILRKHRAFRRRQRKSWCFVYVLKDETGAIRYVGQTRCVPQQRLGYHLISLAKRLRFGERLSPVQAWINEMGKRGRLPAIELIDGNGTWDISEAVWIDRLTSNGCRLLNVMSRVR